MMIDISGWSNL